MIFNKYDKLAALIALCALGFVLVPFAVGGSRLGKITGVMENVVSVNLGRIHGVNQGMRGKVFQFDKEKKTVDIAEVQVINVSDSSCLARVNVRYDTLRVGQFVDIEGTIPPPSIQRVDIIREMEENARNYFSAYRYTEPEGANCWSECQKILALDSTNKLVPYLKREMIRNYYQWAGKEKNNGFLTYAVIYYDRIIRIANSEEQAYENIWDLIDLIWAEAEIPLELIPKGNPPDFYYAVAEDYFRNGQFDKSKAYFQFVLDVFFKDDPHDPAALDGIKKNDRMVALLDSLHQEKTTRERERILSEQKRLEKEKYKKEHLQMARYYQSVAEDLFAKRDLEGALVYYLKLLDFLPDDSVALARREYISLAGLVLIPAGEFSFGSSTGEISEILQEFGYNELLFRELPKRWVYLDSFYIDRYEVTNRQYKRFIESTGYGPPLLWQNGTYPDGEDNLPVTYVSWVDAAEYARWVGKRLPTEEEWEKTARGSNGFRWPWGDHFFDQRCNTKEYGIGKPLPVGNYLNGANEFGVLDLAGNVWEWVDADLKPYKGNEQNAADFAPRRKVMRGGSFKEKGDFARGSFRGDGALDQLYNNVGFRCARDLPGRKEITGGS